MNIHNSEYAKQFYAVAWSVESVELIYSITIIGWVVWLVSWLMVGEYSAEYNALLSEYSAVQKFLRH